ncbi:Uncharacterised protein [Vibrio cholerae]|nr:Uncharacterised protein [Vibrio cholerae]
MEQCQIRMHCQTPSRLRDRDAPSAYPAQRPKRGCRQTCARQKKPTIRVNRQKGHSRRC